LAAAIKKQTQVDPELIKGRGGIFDVRLDGELIYSKHETDRFPEDAEVLQALK